MHNRVFAMDAVFDAIRVPTWFDFGTLLGAKGVKNRARSRLKMQFFFGWNFKDFWIDFGTILATILGAIMDASWDHFSMFFGSCFLGVLE